MKPLPRVVPVIRTYFSDQETWEAICAAIIQAREEGFSAHVEFLGDAA